MKPKLRAQIKKTKPKLLHANLIDNAAARKEFHVEIQNRFSCLVGEGETECLWENFKEYLVSAAKKILLAKKQTNDTEMDDSRNFTIDGTKTKNNG